MHQKFSFLRTFDPERETQEDEAQNAGSISLVIPPKTFEQGFEEGFQKGIAQQQSTQQEQVSECVQRISEVIERKHEKLLNDRQAMLKLVIDTIKSVVDIMAPRFSHNIQMMQADMSASIQSALEHMRCETATVYVNPAFEPLLKSSFSSVSGDVVVRAKQELAEGDFQVHWQGGGIERTQAHVAESLTHFLDQLLHTSIPQIPAGQSA